MKKKLEIITPPGSQGDDKPKKMVLEKRTKCIRCGNCCKGGGPVLLRDDSSLFLSGKLSYDNINTIREGEPVQSAKDSEVFISSLELLKIKSNEGSAACIFYDKDNGCSIYENRPLQCRDYKCWATADVLRGLEKEALTRKDIFNTVGPLLEIIERHEDKCSYKKLSDAAEKLAGGEESLVDEIIDMLQFDTYARPFIAEKFGVPSEAIDLVLGRPLSKTISAFGFTVEKNGDEYILLPVNNEEGK